jgi:hypothetical protein
MRPQGPRRLFGKSTCPFIATDLIWVHSSISARLLHECLDNSSY